ncbi:MAG: hypothetical protein ACE5F5_01320 [Acidimicrobiia bacterium]
MPSKRWQLPSAELDLTRGALVGIVNVTPESFSDGGEFLDPEKASEPASLAVSAADLLNHGRHYR